MSLDELCQKYMTILFNYNSYSLNLKIPIIHFEVTVLLFKLVYVIYKHPLYNVSRLWYNRLCTYYTLNK